jgi:hypothetical protein
MESRISTFGNRMQWIIVVGKDIEPTPWYVAINFLIEIFLIFVCCICVFTNINSLDLLQWLQWRSMSLLIDFKIKIF